MKKMLIISKIYFPQADPITSIVYRYLENMNYKKKIVISKILKEDSKIPLWLIQDLKNEQNISVSTNFNLKNKQFRKVILFWLFIKFYIVVTYYFIKKIVFGDYNAIFTCSMPGNCHWFGALGKIFNKRWIAFFSDPYSNSPFESEKNLKSIKFKLRCLEEKLAFRYADKIIYVSEAQRKFCYKGNKIEKQTIIIPFYYLSEWKKKINENIKFSGLYDKKKVNIIHAGNIYGNRNPKELFKALEKANNNILLHNCGRLDEKIIEENKIEKKIKKHGHLDYENMLKHVNEADYFLVLDSFFKKISNPYMPSKVVDAMYFNKPIIAITEEGTELAKFCEVTKNVWVKNNEKDILEVLNKISEGLLIINPNYNMYKDLKFDI